MFWQFAAAWILGVVVGYILKDQLTEEYKSEISIRKLKVKGDGNRMDLDLDQDLEISTKRLTLRERLQARRNRKQPK